MRFLVDAQLPLRLAVALRAAGHDAAHTMDLPRGNRSPDSAVVAVADREDRIVVSKDEDFVESHILQGRPAKLLLVTTGNVSNNDLLDLLKTTLPDIERAFRTASFVELTWTGVVLRD